MAEIRATPSMTLTPAVNGAMPNGDRRSGLEAVDDAEFGMTSPGMRDGPAAAMAKIDVGAFLDPSRYYFRAAVCFETAAPKYDWLNRIGVIGPGGRPPKNFVHEIFPVHDNFEVL